MLKALRRWHHHLLHVTWGLPEQAPGKHLPVAAHGRKIAHPHLRGRANPSFQRQLERELAREPHILTGLQKRIGERFQQPTAER